MANTITAVVPKLLAQGLMALRQQAIMPRLVNRAYESMAGQRGSTIDVPIPSAITAQAVSPANTPPSTADIAPTSVPIALDQWYEAPFYLTDKERMEVMAGVLPMQASEAIKALANTVDSYLMGLYKGIYGYVGPINAAISTPFTTDVSEATNARKVLNKQLAPMDDRFAVIDPDAEAKALALAAFRDASQAGDTEAIKRGLIGMKLGMMWFMDQNVVTHTAGTLSDGTNHKALVNGALSAGATTMNIDSTTLTGTVVIGDIFQFAGRTETHVATNLTTASGNAITGITFSPALPAAIADNTVVSFANTHVVNLAMHRDAIAFATRPLEAEDVAGLGSIVSSAVDPISGLTLRLEVTREHKRIRYSYDILYGGKLVRAELATRIAG